MLVSYFQWFVVSYEMRPASQLDSKISVANPALFRLGGIRSQTQSAIEGAILDRFADVFG
jgi:hypothetical protein